MLQRVRNGPDDCTICLETAAYCSGHGGKHTEAGDIRLMLGCAEICEASANVMQRGSKLGMGARVKSAPT